jgi:uncharacterized protein YbaR (Trm112 family)
MRLDTLEILRCPYCGGRLSLVDALFHRRTADEVQEGILGCHCCIFPIVDGIPVLHLQPEATAAREQVQAGRPDLARRTLFGVAEGSHGDVFEAAAASSTATYRSIIEALGTAFEGSYFIYRFSDPNFVVADAVVRAVAGTVVGGGRAIDVCGGSGHLTRTLIDVTSRPPILADLYFAKVWLARRFTAPGCEPICCDGNAPLPFARGAFTFAMCMDAFMFIWTKRQLIGEMVRLVGGRDNRGAVLIGHAHNQRVWSPSHGQPLPPDGYADLFEGIEPRLFAEAPLFEDVVAGGPLDLSRRDSKDTLDQDPALTIIATHNPGVFAQHALSRPESARGEFRLNPLYEVEPDGTRVRLRLRFPGTAYEDEYGACRRYLPEESEISRSDFDALPAAQVSGTLADLARRRVVLDLPKRYY